MKLQAHTFKQLESLPKQVLLPQQSHSARIVEIKTGDEDLCDCDGLWTTNPDFLLGVKTADCAPIAIWNERQFGIVHAGWRGTVNGAIENLLAVFQRPSPDGNLNFHPRMKIWIGPILPRFEIQKDNCYQQIKAKFGSQFFNEVEDKIIFEFEECLKFMLPTAQFDSRSTFEDSSLASWRRDKHFENGQNTTVIGFFNPPQNAS